MPRRPYQAQFDKKTNNNAIVLNSIKDKPKRYSEIKEDTGFKDRTLSKTLKRLQEDKSISHSTKTRLYSIVDAGLELLKTADISYITNRIRDRDGIYHHHYLGVMDTLMLGDMVDAIRPFLYIDANLHHLNLLSSSDVADIQRLLYKKISKAIRNNNLVEQNTGDIVFGFVIDYHKTEKLVKTKKRRSKK